MGCGNSKTAETGQQQQQQQASETQPQSQAPADNTGTQQPEGKSL